MALASSGAWAETEFLPDLPEHLQYLPPSREFAEPAVVNRDIAAIDAKLAAENLTPLNTQEQWTGTEPLLRIYSDFGLNHYAFVYVGFELSDAKLLGKAMYHPDGYVFHGTLERSGATYALFAADAGIPSVQRMIEGPSKQRSSLGAKRWFVRLLDRLDFIPTAEAGLFDWLKKKPTAECTTPPPSNEPVRKLASEVQDAMGEPKKEGFQWWRCPKGVVQGAWNATGGVVVNAAKVTGKVLKGTWTLVTKPKEFWKQTTATTKKVGAFFKNFSVKEMFKSAKAEYMKKSFNEKFEHACKVAAEICTGVALTTVPLSSGTSLAQKTIQLYRESALYRSIVDKSKTGMEYMLEKGTKFLRVR